MGLTEWSNFTPRVHFPQPLRLTRRNFLRFAGVLGLAGTTGMVTSGCELSMEAVKAVLRGSTMGTYFAVTYITGPEIPPENTVRQHIEHRFADINQQMSTYIPSSEISRFNRMHEVNKPFPISDDFYRVMKEALRLYRVTQGALDVTVGPLVNLWGFGPEGRPNRVPSAAAIARTQRYCGMDKIELRGHALVKRQPDVAVDLSAIAKGYGVDAIADELNQLGIERFLVDVGGEVRGQGTGSRGDAWRVAVERPVPTGNAPMDRVIHLVNSAVATSGDYRNYYEQDGQRFSHTIDPKTGQPITHNLASVTVLDKCCMTADGLATGLDVMGPVKGMEMAEAHDLAVVMITKEKGQFREIASSAWKQMMW